MLFCFFKWWNTVLSENNIFAIVIFTHTLKQWERQIPPQTFALKRNSNSSTLNASDGYME